MKTGLLFAGSCWVLAGLVGHWLKIPTAPAVLVAGVCAFTGAGVWRLVELKEGE